MPPATPTSRLATVATQRRWERLRQHRERLELEAAVGDGIASGLKINEEEHRERIRMRGSSCAPTASLTFDDSTISTVSTISTDEGEGGDSFDADEMFEFDPLMMMMSASDDRRKANTKSPTPKNTNHPSGNVVRRRAMAGLRISTVTIDNNGDDDVEGGNRLVEALATPRRRNACGNDDIECGNRMMAALATPRRQNACRARLRNASTVSDAPTLGTPKTPRHSNFSYTSRIASTPRGSSSAGTGNDHVTANNNNNNDRNNSKDRSGSSTHYDNNKIASDEASKGKDERIRALERRLEVMSSELTSNKKELAAARSEARDAAASASEAREAARTAEVARAAAAEEVQRELRQKEQALEEARRELQKNVQESEEARREAREKGRELEMLGEGRRKDGLWTMLREKNGELRRLEEELDRARKDADAALERKDRQWKRTLEEKERDWKREMETLRKNAEAKMREREAERERELERAHNERDRMEDNWKTRPEEPDGMEAERQARGSCRRAARRSFFAV